MGEEMKVFYSWQSDLPEKENRFFIEEIIKKAIKGLRNTIDVVADRDTKNETGSPNIEETIFRKISECDAFVADISLVGKYVDSKKRERYTPNANVLIELGFAIKVLGWDRVICFFNIDHGQIEQLPFDLRQHRVLTYSLNGMEKSVVRDEIGKTLVESIKRISEEGARKREGFPYHIVGCYDFNAEKVVKSLVPTEIANSTYAEEYRNQLQTEIKEKIDKVSNLILDNNSDDANGQKVGLPSDNREQQAISTGLDFFTRKRAAIREDEKQEINQIAKCRFGVTLNESFFDLGNLKYVKSNIPIYGDRIEGTKQEEAKYYLIRDILTLNGRLELFDLFLEAFNGLIFINLAIENESRLADRDISIDITVDRNTAEAISVNDGFGNGSLKSIADMIYKEDIIEPLLKLKVSSDIHDCSDYIPQPVAAMAKQASVGMMVDVFGRMNEPQYNIDDCVDEMSRFIENPIDGRDNEYEFHVSTLRPKEIGWIGRGILLKPKTEEIIVTYKITSESTDGSLKGELRYKGES